MIEENPHWKNEPKEWKTILRKSNKYRGEIIDRVSILERQLDVYISTYFCDNMDRCKEFANIILGANRISLDGKRKLFDILIKKQRPDFYKLYKSFNADMNTTMFERNSFAHNMVYLGPEGVKRVKTEIGLLKFSNKNRVEWYTEERVKSIISVINKCTGIISRAARPRMLALRIPDEE